MLLTKRAIAGVHDGKGPRMNVLLFGPPGTGKTELSYAYARAMDLPITRIEMNRMNAYSAEGEEMMAEIAAAIRKNPFAVILLDEIEKTRPDVINNLLSAFDSGFFTAKEPMGSLTRRNITVSVQHATFFMTSNAGVAWINQRVKIKGPFAKGLEANEEQEAKQALMKGGIPAPFLDRIQSIIPVTLAHEEDFMAVIRFHLNRQLNRMSLEKKTTIELVNEDEFLYELASTYFHAQASNRDVLKLVFRFLDEGIVNALLDDDFSPGNPDTKIELECLRQRDRRQANFSCRHRITRNVDKQESGKSL